jgi:hypothetical protein
MRKTLAALALAALHPAHAAEWAIAYDASNGEAVTFIDVASVKRAGSTVTFWVNSYTKPDPKSQIRNLLARYRVDCGEQTSLTLMTVAYLKNGDNRSDTSPDVRPTPLVPGSIGEAHAAIACDKAFPDRLDEDKVQKVGAELTLEDLADVWFSADKPAKKKK